MLLAATLHQGVNHLALALFPKAAVLSPSQRQDRQAFAHFCLDQQGVATNTVL